MSLTSTTVPAAYQGPGFKRRHSSMKSEVENLQVNSEFETLKEVILFVPGDEVHHLEDPNEAQHLAAIDQTVLEQQIVAYAKLLQKLGITVHRMLGNDHTPPNLMYVRDLFFNSPEGAIVSRMASEARAGEEFYIGLELAKQTIPTRLSVTGHGTFEGADALWLDPQNVVVGLGQRTNSEAYKQISWSLKQIGVTTHKILLPSGIQHLLGILQIVGKNTALVRTEKAPKKLLELLKKFKYKVIAVTESEEVTNRQGMNIVTIKSFCIVMPKNCPELKKLYAKNKIKVVAEVDISELLKGGGGLACATGILARSLV